MIWSHNDLWMLTADHSGFVKYWQSNMNNVKMYQAHRDPIRGLRWDILRTAVASSVCQSGGISAATLDIQACFLVSWLLMTMFCVTDWCICSLRDSCCFDGDVNCTIDCLILVCNFQLLVSDRCLLTLLRDSVHSVIAMLSLKAVFNKTGLIFEKNKASPMPVKLYIVISTDLKTISILLSTYQFKVLM